MDNIEEGSEITDEGTVFDEFESKTSSEFPKTGSKSTIRSNKGSITSRKSNLSKASLDKLKNEVSGLRKSVSSNKSIRSKSSNEGSRISKSSVESNGSEAGQTEKDSSITESRMSSSKVSEEIQEAEDYVKSLRQSLLSDHEIFSPPENSKEPSIESESIIDNDFENKTSEEELQAKSSKTSKSSLNEEFALPSAGSPSLHPAAESRSISNESQSIIDINKSSFDESDIVENVDKSKEKLETITEDEEAADREREQMGADKPSLKTTGEGMKANLSKESGRKHGRTSRTAKSEVKGVQFPVTPDVSTRRISNYDPKKIRFSVNPRRESIFSLMHLQTSSSDANYQSKGQHQLGPSYKFDTRTVEEILKRCVEKAKKTLIGYNSKVASAVTAALAAEVMKCIKEEHYDRYRYCVEVKIGENLMQGVHSDAQCLWDRKFDSYATCVLQRPSYFIFVVCYGIYKE